MKKFPHKKIRSDFWQFLKKHAKVLAVLFTICFFILTFIISVAGGLRGFFPYLSSITGFPFSQKNYLVLFQNNQEIRPTGGFISSFALVQFQSGFPVKIAIEDVYGSVDDHEYLEPPYPMKELLNSDWYNGYSFRDGNFNPDFPSSAEELIKLYKITNPDIKIDGVFAVNFDLLVDLVDAVGPIELDNKILNSQNLFEEITNSVNDVDRHNLESLATRKSILKPLADQLIRKIVLNPFKIRKVSDTIVSALSQKEIQLYFKDKNLQEFVVKNRWSGRLPSGFDSNKQDFLAVVEANLGGMKSNRYIQRNITYLVKISEASLAGKEPIKAHLDLEIKHFGIENIPLSGPYNGYFRFFKNPEQTNFSDEIINLNPGETKYLKHSFDLPAEILQNREYSLFLSKQSGTNDFYTIIIQAPKGWTVNSNDFESRENFGFFQGKILRDQQFRLNLLPDQLPPRLVSQQNTQLNQILLQFNEDLDQNQSANPLNYEISDLNITNSETTDQISIQKIEATPTTVLLHLQGQSNQPNEHYGIKLKNLSDNHGNTLSDRQITVVQRLR